MITFLSLESLWQSASIISSHQKDYMIKFSSFDGKILNHERDMKHACPKI